MCAGGKEQLHDNKPTKQVRAGFRTDVRQRRVSKQGHNVVVPSAAVVHVPSASGGDMAQDAPSEGYLRMQTGEGHEDALVPKQCMERDQREHTAHPTHSTSATYTASCHVGPSTKCERQWVGGSEMRCTRVVDGHATYRPTAAVPPAEEVVAMAAAPSTAADSDTMAGLMCRDRNRCTS